MENNENVDIFIKDLERKINIDEKQLEEAESKKQNILSLIEYIKNLQNLLLDKKDEESSVIRCDIGDGVYINGKLNKETKKILINVGSNVYVDLTYPEAIDNLLIQKSKIEKKIVVIRNELIKNKSYIKLTKGIKDTLFKHQLLEGNMVKPDKNEILDNAFNI